ncbi:MAG: hypothetical protein HY675_08175 [Chloroflexi bacterium]|nr:hypothetical protein [Chloroflexota bacterium]
MIEFRRSGGIAGLNDRMIIDSSGKVTISRKSGGDTFVLDRKDLEEILRQAEDAGFAKLETEYLPANRCCDLIEYDIVYKGREVRTMDTAVPLPLQPLLESLNKLVDRRR